MAFRQQTTRDEVISSSNFGETLRGVFRMGGGWGNVSGPGIFMLRVILTGTVTAAATGLFAGMVSAPFFGTASLPFVVASSFGFVLGTAGFYHDALRKALLSLDRYPALLRLHLDANYPGQGFLSWDAGPGGRLHSERFARGWRMQSMLVTSWLTAVPALDRLMELEEEAIVTNELEKENWKKRSEGDRKEER